MKKTYLIGVALLLILSVHTASASSYPDGCTATTKYSSTTGHLCSVPATCQPGDLYDSQTGQPCSQNAYLPGCNSLVGYSVTTGVRCDGALQQVVDSSTPAISTGSISVTSDANSAYNPGLSVGSNQSVNMGFFTVSNTGGTPVTISGIRLGMAGGNGSDSLVYRMYNPPLLVASGNVATDDGDDSEDISPVTINPGLDADFQVQVSGAVPASLAGRTLSTTVSFIGSANGAATIATSIIQ